MVSRIVIGVLLLGLVFLGFVASFSYLNGESKSGKNAGLTAGTEVSLGSVHLIDWGNMKEYVFEYDYMKDVESPNSSRGIDDMRILEVMTLITYKGMVYAVLAPVGEIWSFDVQSTSGGEVHGLPWCSKMYSTSSGTLCMMTAECSGVESDSMAISGPSKNVIFSQSSILPKSSRTKYIVPATQE
jgi:hypothetical protein